MGITLIKRDLPDSTKVQRINDNFGYLEGISLTAPIDTEEINDLYSVLNFAHAWSRNKGIGDLSTNYTGWTWVKDFSGYAVWKYNQSDYTYYSGNVMYRNGMRMAFAGQASSEALTAFDYVYVSGSGGFTDNTTEAATEGGTAFNLIKSGGEYVYIGHASIFTGFEMKFNTYGVGYNLLVEHYSGGAWRNSDIVINSTNSWNKNGLISFDSNMTMQTVSINSLTKYWIRMSTSSTATTIAKVNYLAPSNNVGSLLTWNSEDIANNSFKWCSLGTYLYTTIPRAGHSYHEGSSWIASGSSGALIQDFFTQGNVYSADYKSGITGTRTWGLSGNTALSGNLYILDSTKKLGIGTSTPAVQLDISNGNSTDFTNTTALAQLWTINGSRKIQIRTSGEAVLNLVSDTLTDSGTVGVIGFSRSNGDGEQHRNIAGIVGKVDWSTTSFYVSGGTLQFFTKLAGAGMVASTPRMTIRHNGYIGIGTIEPQTTLDVRGALTLSGAALPYIDDTYDLGSSSYHWDDVYATNGTIQTSDIRNKEEIINTDLGLNFINQLNPVSFKWKNKTRRHYGLIAQEVEGALKGKDFAGFVKDEATGNQGLRYSEFIPIIIKAIQELDSKVVTLK